MSALSFTKLFKSILDSTLWVQQPLHVKVTWIAMLAMADADGMVAASIPGLAQRAGVTVAECEAALAVFLAPDKYSRTPAHEGRRIREIKGGWELLNYVAKRKEMTAAWTREKKREYMRSWRDSKSGDVAPNSLREPECRDVTSLSSSSGSPPDLSRSDPDPEHTPRQPKPGAIFAPADLEMSGTQIVRCQELKLDPVAILRAFKLHEFNRSYTDWTRRLSKWIENEKTLRETQLAESLNRRGRSGSVDALQAQADRITMLRAKEAAEAARGSQ